jgi:hypothetical protein
MAINPPSDNLSLAEVLSAANGLLAAGLIEDWALGGALAAIYYVEPFTTYDAAIFYIPKDKGLTAGVPAIYAHLQGQGWQVDREHLLVHGFPVQFLAAHRLTGEAVREAERIDYEGVPAKVFRAEHFLAIAASVGRAKDKARIEQLLQQADLDKAYLENVLPRHKLKLPAGPYAVTGKLEAHARATIGKTCQVQRLRRRVARGGGACASLQKTMSAQFDKLLPLLAHGNVDFVQIGGVAGNIHAKRGNSNHETYETYERHERRGTPKGKCVHPDGEWTRRHKVLYFRVVRVFRGLKCLFQIHGSARLTFVVDIVYDRRKTQPRTAD